MTRSGGLHIGTDRCNQAGPRSPNRVYRHSDAEEAEEATIQAVFRGISPCGPSG